MSVITESGVTEEILEEQRRQFALWGEQNHPTISPAANADTQHKAYWHGAETWKRTNSRRAQAGNIAWDGILLEEAYEALAEEDPVKRRVELVQIAAVAATMIEHIDRELAATS